MVSLWGSKNGDEPHSGDATPRDAEQADDSTSYSRQRHSREADERTRLIPRSAYLDPDDPAVTPYNLWSVRFLRTLSLLFLLISFIWWIVLLVDIFVTPPGLNFRGSGFLSFALTTLSVGNLLVAVLFYASPSQAQRISCLAIAVVLLVDLVFILFVKQIRMEEGWVGVATVGWAALMAIWAVIIDRVVEYAKKEEEERLTGRAETRRTLREWCSVFSSAIVLIVLLVITVLFTATLILRTVDATIHPPGQRLWVHNDKFQVHLYCEGEAKGQPTVFIEGGESPVEGGLASVAKEALENGTINRYCYWDRPGFAFSDNAPSPFSAGMSADALAEALVEAKEEGPLVLVSAGVGSLYTFIFAARHAERIQGIVLIDALHPDLIHRVGNPTRSFGLFLRGIISPLGLERLFGAIFKGRDRADRVFGRSSSQGDKVIKAKLQESLVANGLTKQEVNSALAIQGMDHPLAVLSSGIMVDRDREWAHRQKDLCDMSEKSIGCETIPGAPHEIWKSSKGRVLIEEYMGELVEA